MAMPILFNLRAVEKASNQKFYFAMSNFALDDSGILLELEHDDNHQHPWGVRIVQIKGAPMGYFMNLTEEKLQKISSAMSSFLNQGEGINEMQQPIALSPSNIMKLSELVVTINGMGKDGDLVIETVAESQKELMDALSTLKYFSQGYPEHVLKAPEMVDRTKQLNS